MNWLNYHHLYYFWVIAKEGSVTRASKKLHLSQPTLSSQLKHFEDFIKQPLFDRKSRKLVLNETGKLIFQYADSIFRLGKEMVDTVRVRSQKDPPVTVRAGIMASLPKKNAHKYLKHPLMSGKMLLHLNTGNFDDLISQLLSQNLDLVITHQKASASLFGLHHHVLEQSPFVLVASPEYRSLKRNFPQSLDRQPLFLPSYEEDLKREMERIFNNQGLSPQFKGLIQDTELLRIIALEGQGIVAIAKCAVSDLIKTKELIVIGEDLKTRQYFYLITQEKRLAQSPIADILKNLS